MEDFGGSHDPYEDPPVDPSSFVNSTFELANNSTIITQNGSAKIDFTAADAFYYSICIVILGLFCFVSRSRVPDERFRIAAAERRARWLEQQERKDRMSDPDYRQRLIDKALIIKKVVEESEGQLTLGDGDDGDGGDDGDQNSTSGSISIDSMDENTSTCVICLEAFRVGEFVAWSRKQMLDPQDEACNHVFHKNCILAWLMSPTHDDCPSCRSAIIIEKEVKDEDNESATDACSETSDSYPNSAFVIMHGLVSRVRRASYSLIGHSIKIDDHTEDLELGEGTPKEPPSPIRRVISLEGSSKRLERESLRRRPSSGSIGGPSVSSASSMVLPETQADATMVGMKKSPPIVLRRAESESLLVSPSLEGGSSRPGSVGRPSIPPLRSFNTSYHRVSSFASTHSDISIDEEEDDILVRQVSSEGLGRSLSERSDDDNTIFEHKVC